MSSDSASSSSPFSAQSPSPSSPPRERAHRRPHEKHGRHSKGRKHGSRASTGGAAAAASGTGTSSLRKSRLLVTPPSPQPLPQLPSWTPHGDPCLGRGSVSPFAAGDDLLTPSSSASASASSSPSLYLGAPLTPGTELLMEDTNSRLDSLDINESSSATLFPGSSGLTESALSTQTATDASSVSSFAADPLGASAAAGAGGAMAAAATMGTPCVLPRNNGALFHRTPVLPIVTSPDPFKRPPSAPGEFHPVVPMSPSKMRRCEIPCVPEPAPALFSPLLAPRAARGPKSVLSKSMSSLPRPDLPPPVPLGCGSNNNKSNNSNNSTSNGSSNNSSSSSNSHSNNQNGVAKNHDPVTYDGVTINVSGFSGNCCESMLRAISVDSARELLTGATPLPAGHRLLLADGRLAFEFDAGHIRGAVNITVSDTRGCIREQLLRVVERAHAERQKYFVLVYCEFSSARGPRLGTALRTVERDYLAARCPDSEGAFDQHTCFPHIYAIHGGYSQFFAHHRDLCVPPHYVMQSDPAFADLNRRLEPVYHDQIFDATCSKTLRRSASDMALDDARPAPEPRLTAKPAPRRLFARGMFGASRARFGQDGDDDDDDDGRCSDTDDDDAEQIDYLSSSVSTPTRSMGRRCVSCIASVQSSNGDGNGNGDGDGAGAPRDPSSLEEDDDGMAPNRPIRPPSFD